MPYLVHICPNNIDSELEFECRSSITISGVGFFLSG